MTTLILAFLAMLCFPVALALFACMFEPHIEPEPHRTFAGDQRGRRQVNFPSGLT